MPYEVNITGKRAEIITWLSEYVGKFHKNDHFWSARGEGWELLPYGADPISSTLEPKKYIVRIWDKDKAFLTRLRWE
jgi:hypothetical protein